MKVPLAIGASIRLCFTRTQGLLADVVFVVLLLPLPLLSAATLSPELARFNAFYRTGALVFGGGHVVLPLLERAFIAPGWIGPQNFIATLPHAMGGMAQLLMYRTASQE